MKIQIHLQTKLTGGSETTVLVDVHKIFPSSIKRVTTNTRLSKRAAQKGSESISGTKPSTYQNEQILNPKREKKGTHVPTLSQPRPTPPDQPRWPTWTRAQRVLRKLNRFYAWAVIASVRWKPTCSRSSLKKVSRQIVIKKWTDTLWYLA